MLVVIPIEAKIRELLPKTFIAYQVLKKTKHDVLIGGQRFFSQKIRNYKNVVYLDKNTHFTRLENLINTKKNEICMLDEEGPVSILDEFGVDFHYNKKLLNKVNKFFFWGKEDLNNVKLKFNKNKFIITGHPKYDLLKYPYVNFFEKEIKTIKKKYKKFIFFPSSFSLYNKNLEWEYKNKLKICYPQKNQNFLDKKLNEIIKTLKDSEKDYDKLREVLYNFAVSNPNINIIFRKHPRDDIVEIKKKFINFPKNVILDHSFSVSPWIIACHIYMHSGCTTSLEAAVLRKKIITFIPHRNDELCVFFKTFGELQTNKEKCVKRLNLLINRNEKRSNYKFITRYIYNFPKKKFFYNEFLKYLKNINLPDSKIIYHSESSFNVINFLYPFKKFFMRFLSLAKNILINTYIINFLPEKHLVRKVDSDRKFKNLNLNELNKIFNNFKKIDNQKFLHTVNEISDNVYLIKKR